MIAAQRNAAAAGDVEAFFRLDETMHRSMFEFAGRAHVWGMLEGVKRHFDRVRWLLLERVAYHARRAQEEHEAIMDRLVARDAAGLTLASDHHINAITGHMQELHDRAPACVFHRLNVNRAPVHEDRTSLYDPHLSRTQLRDVADRHRRRRHGLGDATLNGRELAVEAYLRDHVIPLLIGRDPRTSRTCGSTSIAARTGGAAR